MAESPGRSSFSWAGADGADSERFLASRCRRSLLLEEATAEEEWRRGGTGGRWKDCVRRSEDGLSYEW